MNKWELQCYDNIRGLQYIKIPTTLNKVSEATSWKGRQPGHIEQCEHFYLPHWFGRGLRKSHEAHWDGTMNMPLMRLADPKHKESYMMQYH